MRYTKETFPREWCLKITLETLDVINNWRCNIIKYSNIPINYPYYSYITWARSATSVSWCYVEITFEEFEQFVLNKNMKKIKGYKLKKEFQDYKEIASNICSKNGIISDYLTNKKDILYDKIGRTREILEKAGIFNIWFEPVYENEEILVNMGNFELKIISEGIFHKSENITSYVDSINSAFGLKGNCELATNLNLDNKRGKGNWDFIVKDVILSKTGCEKTETKVSQWLNVWKEYQELKE